MTSPGFTPEYENLKAKRANYKSSITRAYNNLQKEISKDLVDFKEVDKQLQNAKASLHSLVTDCEKIRVLQESGNGQDADAMEEAMKYVDEERSRFLTMEADADMCRNKVDGEIKKLQDERQTRMKAIVGALSNLELLLTQDIEKEIVNKASEVLSDLYAKLDPVLIRILELTQGDDRVALEKNIDKLQKEINEANARSIAYVDAAEKSANEALKERADRAKKVGDEAQDVISDLNQCVDARASKHRLYAARLAGQIAKGNYDRGMKRYVQMLAGKDDEQAVKDEWDNIGHQLGEAMKKVNDQLDERKDEETCSSSSRSRSPLREEQTGVVPKAIPQVDGGMTSGTGIQQRLVPVTASSPFVQPMFPTGFHRPVQNRQQTTATYVMNHVQETNSWIEEMLGSGTTDPGEQFKDIRTSVKVELKPFEGDYDEWESWISIFHGAVHLTNLPDETKLAILKKNLSSKGRNAPYKIVRDLVGKSQYVQALALLQAEYGNPHERRKRLRNRLQALREVPYGDSKEMTSFAFDVMSILSAMSRDPCTNQEQVIDEAMTKLPLQESTRWRSWAESMGPQNCNLMTFSQFVADTARSWRECTSAKAATTSIKAQQGQTGTSKGGGSGAARGGGAGGSRNGGQKVATLNAAISDGQLKGCLYCAKDSHKIWACQAFRDIKMDERQKYVRKHNLCFVCLGKGHRAAQDTCSFKDSWKDCPKCGGRHHSLLPHLKMENKPDKPANANATNTKPEDDEEEESQASAHLVARVGGRAHGQDNGLISLGLTNVGVLDGKGDVREVTLFSDNGADTTLVLEEFCKGNGIRLDRGEKTTIIGVGDSRATITSHKVKMTLVAPDGQHYDIQAKTAPRVTGVMNTVNWAVERKHFPHLKDLPLVKTSNRPIILLGEDNAWLLHVLETRCGKPGEPRAERTRLGWFARGPTRHGAQVLSTQTRSVMHMHHAEIHVEDLAEKFYEAESFGTEHVSKSIMSVEDQKAYDLVEKGIRKLPDQPGYEVCLPWRNSNLELKSNWKMAEVRLKGTMAKINKNEKDKADYYAAMQKYKDAGYVSHVYSYDPKEDPSMDRRAEQGQYFLAHHGVRKKQGGKMRIVFDASAEKDGYSLNKALHCGPKLQSDLAVNVIRWREEEVAYTADITAMFSRIRLRPADAGKHRFLWPDEKGRIAVFQMDRVAFGDGPSPCIAISVLRRTADDYGDDPEAVEIIKKGFYIDDLGDSAATVDIANKRAASIARILAQGDFQLSGWASNDPDFILQDKENAQKEIKFLGQRWHLAEDVIRHVCPNMQEFLDPDPPVPGVPSINIRQTVLHACGKRVRKKRKGCVYAASRGKAPSRWTKRELLSLLASIFSSLGLASPLIVKGKIRIARLHLLGLGWDEPMLPGLEEEVEWWQEWMQQVPLLCQIPFTRCLRPQAENIAYSQLHTFTDASEEAIAACCYVRCMYKDGGVFCNVIMAKSKVAPKKTISVAKLELMAALLGARLADYVSKGLRFQIMQRYFWTDSSCTRQWIRSTSSFYMAFVANRIGEIQTLSKPEEWRHVPGKLNPADEATRSELVNVEEQEVISSRWISGPDFLYQDESEWPKDITYKRNLEEVRPRFAFKNFVTMMQVAEKIDWLLKTNNYARALRIRAWCSRWFRRRQGQPQAEIPGELDEEDLARARIGLLQDAQLADFPDEIASLHAKKQVHASSKLAGLTPFLDKDGLMRVGGRIGKSRLPYDGKHRIILSRRNKLTKMIVEYLHRTNNHAKDGNLLNIIVRTFYIAQGREAVKRIFCRKCAMDRAKTGTQQMADLPAERVIPTPPFFNTSMDFFGPFHLKYGARGSKKYWVCLFACMFSRAVHLELVDSLSADDFLLALRNFCNLRGQPKTIYTDNGTNFVGAERRIREQLLMKGIKWNFMPARAPHWGGVHESLVKSCKKALHAAVERSMRRRLFTQTEFQSLLAEVVGFLNGRPLVYQSGEAGYGVALTPNHFLLGRAGKEIPEDAYKSSTIGDHFNFVQATADDVWKCWTEEYLPTQIQRSKWRFQSRNLKVNDVVLVVEDNLPRGQWMIGWVSKVFVGNKGCVRSALVRTPKGEFDRPIVKLCLLEEAPEDEGDIETRKDLKGLLEDEAAAAPVEVNPEALGPSTDGPEVDGVPQVEAEVLGGLWTAGRGRQGLVNRKSEAGLCDSLPRRSARLAGKHSKAPSGSQTE